MLSEIHAEAFPANQTWGAAALMLMLVPPGHFNFIVSMDGDVLGFGLGRVQGPESEILTLAVRPWAQGRGVGRLLLDALLKEAARRGAAEMFLEVAEPNAAARTLYAGAGAEEVGRRPGYYADGTDALVLRIELSRPIQP